MQAKTSTNFTKISTLFSFFVLLFFRLYVSICAFFHILICQYLWIVSQTQTQSEISSRYTNTHLTAQFLRQHILPHNHFLPVVGVKPNRCPPSPDNRHRAVAGNVGHAKPNPTLAPGWPCHADWWCRHGGANHAQAGARHWPRLRRLDTILTILLMGVA